MHEADLEELALAASQGTSILLRALAQTRYSVREKIRLTTHTHTHTPRKSVWSVLFFAPVFCPLPVFLFLFARPFRPCVLLFVFFCFFVVGVHFRLLMDLGA